MFQSIKALGFICLVMAMSIGAQPPSPILDTDGHALQSGVEYYVQPSGANTGGELTLINRKDDSCPFYVGQEELVGSQGLPVIFTPFETQETVIRESRSFSVVFSASTICVTSTAWKLGEEINGRRLIGTGSNDRFTRYFRISINAGRYNFDWCPADVCPTCRFRCGDAGVFVENGKRLLALDGPALFVVFKKA